ncbi:MAG: phosphatase PAP2 family protein [Armatimonas sp.]
MKPWRLIAIVVLVGLLTGLTWLTLTGHLAMLDGAIISTVYPRRSPGLTTAMITISLLGNQVLYVASVGIVAFLIARKRWPELGQYLLLMVGQDVLNSIFKALIARPRPAVSPLVHETSFSFPSGHSMSSVVFYGALAFWLWQKGYGGKYRWLWFIAATVIALAVGTSRVYLGVHYPTDVLAGFLTGAIWLLLVFR